MSLRGFSARFTYSGAVDTNSVQDDPDLSLGGANPDDTQPNASAPYQQLDVDSNSVDPTVIQNDDSIGGDPEDPQVGEWLMVVTGAGAPGYGKIVGVDTVTGEITIDRALPGLPLTGAPPDRFRTSSRQNVFPDVSPPQASAGLVDHRMLYFLKTDAGSENNFRFWVLPIKSNGCDIEIMASGGPELNRVEPSIGMGTDDPFTLYGAIDGRDGGGVANSDWARANKARVTYSEDGYMPDRVGSENVPDQRFMPLWLRRTIPQNAPPGECVFALIATVPDAATQDPGADPLPFQTGFIFSWNNPQPTYDIDIRIDRTAYTDGAAKVIATVRDDQGALVVGLNCWFILESGPGSVNTDVDGVTDENGQLIGVYTSPSSLSVDPVVRLVVPTNIEV